VARDGRAEGGTVEIHDRYAFDRREDGLQGLYAADVRALMQLAKHPRRLRGMGGAARMSLRAIKASLRAEDRRLEAIGRDRLPVLVFFTSAGAVHDVYHGTQPWGSLRRQLAGVA
jgi:hypothetical protein